jgi:predicted amidohydrolase
MHFPVAQLEARLGRLADSVETHASLADAAARRGARLVIFQDCR